MSPAEGILPVGDIPASASTLRLVGAIRDDTVRILANWAMRVSTLPAFRAIPELALGELQEDIPELLEAILDAVGLSPYELDPIPIEEVTHRAEAHGARRAATFSVDCVLSEIQVLQREVRSAIWRNAQDLPSATLHEFDERLNEVFESAERGVVVAWVLQHDALPVRIRRGDAA
jgi:hypothetical protein